MLFLTFKYLLRAIPYLSFKNISYIFSAVIMKYFGGGERERGEDCLN
jgi:hypothetical protein